MFMLVMIKNVTTVFTTFPKTVCKYSRNCTFRMNARIRSSVVITDLFMIRSDVKCITRSQFVPLFQAHQENRLDLANEKSHSRTAKRVHVFLFFTNTHCNGKAAENTSRTRRTVGLIGTLHSRSWVSLTTASHAHPSGGIKVYTHHHLV